MADGYITDPALLSQLQADESLEEQYVSNPTILSQLGGPKTAQEIAGQPKTFVENLLAPNVPQELDPLASLGRIGASTAIGAGTGLVFPVVGPIAGGVSGLASGIAGEIAAGQGASDAVRFGVEGAAGGATSIAGPLARSVSKLVSPVSYRGGRAVSILETNRLRNRALDETKVKLFGKPTFDTFATPVNAEETQLALRQTLGNMNIPNDQKVSSYVRQNLYSKLKGLQSEMIDSPASYSSVGLKNPTPPMRNVFINSSEYKELMEGVKDLVSRTRMSRTEVANLNRILAEDLSQRKGVSEFATDDIINLIQNGGVYQVSKKGAEAETKTKIPEDARKLLRTKFNNFLENRLGKDDPTYNQLKEIEKAEFIAEARDAIPALINNKFRVGSEELDNILSTVRNSPEGKRDLVNAVNQHLASFDDGKKLLSEFARLRAPLKEAGIYTDDQIRQINKKISTFDKRVDAQTKLDFLKTVLISPTLGISQAEAGREAVNMLRPKPSPIPAFNM